MAVETVRYSIYHSVNSDSSQEPFDFELHSSVGCAADKALQISGTVPKFCEITEVQ